MRYGKISAHALGDESLPVQFECKTLMSALIIIRLEKHLQCEKLLGLARGTTKKHGNKKSDESINSNPLQRQSHACTDSFPGQYNYIPRNFYWWSDDQSLYIFTFWNVQAYNHDDLMFLIHAVFSTGTHSPTWEGLAGESKSNMHGPYW